MRIIPRRDPVILGEARVGVVFYSKMITSQRRGRPTPRTFVLERWFARIHFGDGSRRVVAVSKETARAASAHRRLQQMKKRKRKLPPNGGAKQ